MLSQLWQWELPKAYSDNARKMVFDKFEPLTHLSLYCSVLKKEVEAFKLERVDVFLDGKCFSVCAKIFSYWESWRERSR